MQDLRMTRIQKQLRSSTHMLEYAAAEAESLKSQDLAEDLHELLEVHRQVMSGISQRGQTYRRPHAFPTVRA
jgi:predicted ATPase